MSQPTVSAGLVRGLLTYAAQRGADREELGATAGLAPGDLDDPDNRLPLIRYIDLMRLAKQATGDPALALRFGADVAMSEVSILGLIMEASATMGEAFVQLQRYGRLALELDAAAGPRFRLEQRKGKLFMVDGRTDPEAFPELTESAFASLVCGPRRFLAQPHVLGVHVPYPAPAYREDYERIFQCPVHFGAEWTALELHPEVAGWSVAQNPRYVFSVLTERAETLLAEQAAARSVRGQLEALLMTVLHHGDPRVDAMAARMGMTRMTLYRRLKDEGTTFAAVLDDLRRRLAIQYLQGRRVSVNETAYLVGFSDPAAFSRAFKRWTGKAPGAFLR